MPELTSHIKLSEFMRDSDIRRISFVSFVGHRDHASVYGSLFDTDKGLLFQQHKWTEVNKGKSLPKVFAEMQYKHKMTSDEIYNSFDRLSTKDYYERDALDMMSV